jgi:hypothetical protein
VSDSDIVATLPEPSSEVEPAGSSAARRSLAPQAVCGSVSHVTRERRCYRPGATNERVQADMAGCFTYEALALEWLYDDSPPSPIARLARRQRVYETFAEALQGRWSHRGFSFHDFALKELNGLSRTLVELEALVRRRVSSPSRLHDVVLAPLRPWPEAAERWLAAWLFGIREPHASDWWVHVEPFEAVPDEYAPLLRDVWLRTIAELDGVTPETQATIVRSDRVLEAWGDGWCDVGLSLVLDTAPCPRVVHAGVTTD